MPRVALAWPLPLSLAAASAERARSGPTDRNYLLQSVIFWLWPKICQNLLLSRLAQSGVGSRSSVAFHSIRIETSGISRASGGRNDPAIGALYSLHRRGIYGRGTR